MPEEAEGLCGDGEGWDVTLLTRGTSCNFGGATDSSCGEEAVASAGGIAG